MRLSEIARHLGGRLLGDDAVVRGLKPLYAACAQDLSVLAWPKDIRLAKMTKAAALIINSDWAADYADEIPSCLIVVDDLIKAFAALAGLHSLGYLRSRPLIAEKNIHDLAQICKSASIAKAHIGAHTSIGHNAVIGDDVIVGSHCTIGPGVVIHDGARLGHHCLIGAQTIIGSPAFAPFGDQRPQALASLGNVQIGDHVRVQALCTIDRGLIGSTWIGDHCHLDSQVHIGHDAYLGPGVIMAAQSGLAGFVRIGAQATIGGQAGVGPHVEVGMGARVSGKTFVHKNIGIRAICSGNPGLPHELYLRDYKKKLTMIRNKK